MNTRLIKTLEQVESVLSQAGCIEPDWESKDECYQWTEKTLRHFRYTHLNRTEKVLIKRYLMLAFGQQFPKV